MVVSRPLSNMSIDVLGVKGPDPQALLADEPKGLIVHREINRNLGAHCEYLGCLGVTQIDTCTLIPLMDGNADAPTQIGLCGSSKTSDSQEQAIIKSPRIGSAVTHLGLQAEAPPI